MIRKGLQQRASPTPTLPAFLPSRRPTVSPNQRALKAAGDAHLVALAAALITVRGLPAEEHRLQVNGKPAMACVIERQTVRTDNDFSIVSGLREVLWQGLLDG